MGEKTGTSDMGVSENWLSDGTSNPTVDAYHDCPIQKLPVQVRRQQPAQRPWRLKMVHSMGDPTPYTHSEMIYTGAAICDDVWGLWPGIFPTLPHFEDDFCRMSAPLFS